MKKLLSILFFLVYLSTYSQCPNNNCENAYELTLCVTETFSSQDCNSYEGYPVLQSANLLQQGYGSVSNYAGLPPYVLNYPTWWKVFIPIAGWHDFSYLTNLINTNPSSTNIGVGWAILYGGCEDVNITMNTATNSPVGWFAASTAYSDPWTCPVSVCDNGMITYFVEQPIGFPYPPYSPTVSNTSNWNMSFYLLEGWHYILLSSRQSTTFAEEGTINICPTTALPVELAFFKASEQADHIKIFWRTLSEINASHFILESSIDGVNFKKIDQIKASGNSAQSVDYYSLDYQPFQGINYYRLIQVDYDGKSRVYDPVAVEVKNNYFNSKIQVYPNPSEQVVYINSYYSYDVPYQTFSSKGQLTFAGELKNGLNTLSFENKGIFIIRTKEESVKIVIE